MAKEPVSIPNADSTFMIELPKKELGEFIASLLGQPRKLSQRFVAKNFCADQNFIVNIVDVIDQRLSQNNHKLISFSASIFFKNGRKYSVESSSALKAFHDNSSDETCGVDIRMSFLVEFQGQKIPEKQSVRVQMFSNERFLYEIKPSRFLEGDSLLAYEIDCTNVTWGEDVSRYLANHFDSIIVRKWYAAVENFFNAHGILISIFISFPMFIGMFFVIPLNFSLENVKILHKTYQSLGGDNTKDISNKIDIIEKIVTENPLDSRNLHIFWPSVIMFIITILMMLITRPRLFFGYFNRSFVIFNNHTNKNHESYLRYLTLIKSTIIGGLIMAIIAGIISARLDKFLF